MTTAAATQFLPLAPAANLVRDSLVVSLHDLAPSNRETSEKIVQELTRRGVRVCSLLVVPDYHHQGLMTKDRQFVSWLRRLESEGYEIVIHGFFHERPRGSGESLPKKFFTRVYTQDEGEFFDLDYAEALHRITTARDEFRGAGLNPRGFIAPAWLLSRAAERAARDAEMEYTTRLNAVRDLRLGEDFSSHSMVYSVRAEWRRTVSLAWNATLYQIARHDALVRLSIHPVDYSHPAIWSQINRFVDQLAHSRTPTTYQDWIADQRVKKHRLV